MKSPCNLIRFAGVLLALSALSHAGVITNAIDAGTTSFSYVQDLSISNAVMSDLGFNDRIAYGTGGNGGNHLYVNETGTPASCALKFQTTGTAVISGGTLSLNYWLTQHWATEGGSLRAYLWNNDPNYDQAWQYYDGADTVTATKYTLLDTSIRTGTIQNLTVNLSDYGITNTSNIVLVLVMQHNAGNWTAWDNTEEFLTTSGSTPGLNVFLDIPEPASLGLLALGGLALLRRRRG
ncbi:MAG: PEP-CTERM sorting domain-containing protein [Lentisphaeria bacterium]